MSMTLRWVPKKPNKRGEQYLVLRSKSIKGTGVQVARVGVFSNGGHYARLMVDTFAGRGGQGYADREAVIKLVEKKFGIYKEPKKKKVR